MSFAQPLSTRTRFSAVSAAASVFIRLALAFLATGAGCERQQRSEPVLASRPVESRPESAPAAAPATRPAADPNRVAVRVHSVDEPQEGWLTIEQIEPGSAVASARAAFLPLDNKLMIDTEHVRRFSVDLSALRIRWERRVILRVDRINAELSKKNWPIVHFEVTPAGDWVVVAP